MICDSCKQDKPDVKETEVSSVLMMNLCSDCAKSIIPIPAKSKKKERYIAPEELAREMGSIERSWMTNKPREIKDTINVKDLIDFLNRDMLKIKQTLVDELDGANHLHFYELVGAYRKLAELRLYAEINSFHLEK